MIIVKMSNVHGHPEKVTATEALYFMITLPYINYRPQNVFMRVKAKMTNQLSSEHFHRLQGSSSETWARRAINDRDFRGYYRSCLV